MTKANKELVDMELSYIHHRLVELKKDLEKEEFSAKELIYALQKQVWATNLTIRTNFTTEE